MAKKSVCNRESKRIMLCKRYSEKRNKLKVEMQVAMNDRDIEQVMDLQFQLQKLPRNSSPSRIRRRCELTGRPRGTYRKVGLSKIKFREYAMRGEIPGLVLASW